MASVLINGSPSVVCDACHRPIAKLQVATISAAEISTRDLQDGLSLAFGVGTCVYGYFWNRVPDSRNCRVSGYLK